MPRPAARVGISELELPELDDPRELDELLELEEPDDDELDEELDDEDDDELGLDEELELPDPLVGAFGESPHAVVRPAAARKVPCESSRRKSRRA